MSASDYTSKDIERFWRKVAKTDNPDDCWLWTGAVDGCEYGDFRQGGYNRKTHRFVWEITNGDIPKGICICHKCDTPRCVNPNHLFLGTHTDNMRDMNAKGRAVHYSNEQNGNAKLTNEQVEAIRSKYSRGGITQKQLAQEFGVIQAHISRIVRRVNRI